MISVLYLTNDDQTRERFGFKNENEARSTAWGMVADGYRNVVIRCTSTEGNVTITHWTEEITNEPLVAPEDPTTAFREAISDIVTHTLPQLLLEVQRMALRGTTPPLDWIEDAFIGIDEELCAVL